MEIPKEGIELLRGAGHDVDMSEKDGVLTREELIAVLKKKPYDAVLTTLNDQCTEDIVDAAPSVKIIANYAVGFDNIDVEVMKKRGIVVTNTPGVLTDAVAEHTAALMFAVAKRIPEADRYTRAGKYKGWGPMLMLGTQLGGMTLGLIGAGRIGSRVAEIASCMGMKIIYFDINRNDDIERRTGATYISEMEGVLKESDFVSLHVPLLDSTRHLIDKKRLSLMKPTACLINTSRGPVVDEAALVEALTKGTIRGAALDVFENEPHLAPGLADLENVVLTPHIASATESARASMSTTAARNIIDFFAGKIPENVVS